LQTIVLDDTTLQDLKPTGLFDDLQHGEKIYLQMEFSSASCTVTLHRPNSDVPDIDVTVMLTASQATPRLAFLDRANALMINAHQILFGMSGFEMDLTPKIKFESANINGIGSRALNRRLAGQRHFQMDGNLEEEAQRITSLTYQVVHAAPPFPH